MSEDAADSSDFLQSDDSTFFDFFPSSQSFHSISTHRFTSPPQESECQDASPRDPPTVMVLKPRTLPLELIEYIIELYYCRYPSFRALRAFSEASSLFRTVALRRYMTSLNLDSSSQLISLSHMHTSILSRGNNAQNVGLHWVKNLTGKSDVFAKAPWTPHLLSGLRTLHISFAMDARSTQKIRLRQIFDFPTMHSPMTHLTSLTLTEMWRIDVPLLSTISWAFPALMSLHLSCSEHLDVSCCWACFEDSSSAVIHSPIPTHFSTVSALTIAFAKALKPLTNLTHLHLGLFLSDEEMLNNHIEHYDSPRAYQRVLRTAFGRNNAGAHTGTVLSQAESTSNGRTEHVSYTEDEDDPDDSQTAANMTFDDAPPFPHGPELCPICAIIVSAPEVRTRELEASLSLARKLKSLRTISWSSFFAWRQQFTDEKKVGDWERATRTYVLRAGGRVRVRRRPWD